MPAVDVLEQLPLAPSRAAWSARRSVGAVRDADQWFMRELHRLRREGWLDEAFVLLSERPPRLALAGAGSALVSAYRRSPRPAVAAVIAAVGAQITAESAKTVVRRRRPSQANP